MNLSMLKAFLERPAAGRAGRISFADTLIWGADGGRYRNEYACYPVISLDFLVLRGVVPLLSASCVMFFRANALA